MSARAWQFSIDVGGTFTDVVAHDRAGGLHTFKLLSSGAIRGQVGQGSSANCIIDPRRIGEPDGLWTGYTVSTIGEAFPSRDRKGAAPTRVRVTRSDGSTGALHVSSSFAKFVAKSTASYDLRSHEEAPVVAIRALMGKRLDEPIGPVEVRLGTTRATNALLERTGARVAFVTTKGFADVLKIGYQDRPSLFDLNIRKREELAETVIEIDERLSAGGEILRSPDEDTVRRGLQQVRERGIESVAICLLHAHVNPVHEQRIARVAASVGFAHVSVSSQVMPVERIVPRGDTTVADAYLSGVIRAYVASLRRSMPEAKIRLMTSSGGLIDAALASGKDTVLSGPAGGAVGCAAVTYAAGFDRAIGFDMGGTSTDVCRIEAPPRSYEFQHETVKAGVRIMAPMIAVETVAAGGGSICAFDGQKLTVGPRSAGADPGPACYGCGGPLTITDMNVALGRVLPAHFPFTLDREVVDRRLRQLAGEISSATNATLTPPDLASGFVQIANANMAAAIKKISIAKGYDPADYVLTSFGGAAAQHACGVADILGIRRILCSPFAGVLSAKGISVATIQRVGQRGVRVRWSATAGSFLVPLFDEIELELRHSLRQEGVVDASIAAPIRDLDVCYAGQSTLLTVAADPIEGLRERFEALHRQLYGYIHSTRDIEIRIARSELRVLAETLPEHSPAPRNERAGTASGTDRSVPLHHRDSLRVGKTIPGPVIIVEDFSTIVIDPGWNATLIESGDIVMTHAAAASSVASGDAAVDPVRLELYHNQFAAIAEQMGATLRRTALSVNVKERLDFSCAVFTADGDLVANAPHIPVHLGGMSDCVKRLMEDVGRFEPGDVYVTNDPYRGGSHLNDVTVITPVHDDNGTRILFFVANRAHHAEIGGTRPGSMPPDSKSLADEGVLLRAFRLVEKGRSHADDLRALLTIAPHPSRAPDENLADIAAQVAANQTGVQELLALIRRDGLDVVTAYMRHIQDAAENKMRAALRKLPSGVRRFEDALDDGTTVRLAITLHDGEATIDFSGTDPVHPGNLNANRSIVISAVMYCLRCLIDEDIPLNAGVLAPVKIILPTCFLNPPSSPDPRKCPAIVGGNVETSQRIVDCIFGALGVVAAGQGTMNNLLMGNERFGYYETLCGGAGAGPTFHGADAVHTHMTNTRLTDPEVLEARYPVRLIRFEIRRKSGGIGKFQGGDGVIREFEFLEPLDVSILSQRRAGSPYGMYGGGGGRPGRNTLRRKDATSDELLPGIVSLRVHPGDRLTLETPGGGGWGKK